MNTKTYATRKFSKELPNGDVIKATAELVQHGNQSPYLSITGELYDRDRIPGEASVLNSKGKRRYLGSCGQIVEDIKEHFPALSPYLKWHLTSLEGPMHYLANTIYLAGDKDHNGLRKGEQRQMRNNKGLPMWKRDRVDYQVLAAEECPTESVTVSWEPCMIIGAGKERNLEAARSCAVWPDATDDDLTAEGLEERLVARLPKLMEDFKNVLVSLFEGQVQFEGGEIKEA